MHSRKTAIQELNRLWTNEIGKLDNNLKSKKKGKSDKVIGTDKFIWQADKLHALRDGLKKVDGTEVDDNEAELELEFEPKEDIE